MSDAPTPVYKSIDHTKLDFQGTLLHQANPFQTLELTLHLFKPPATRPTAAMQSKENKTIYDSPLKRTYLTHKDLTELVGTRKEDISQLADFFSKHQFKLVSSNRLARTLKIKGTIAAINVAFKTNISVYQGPNKFVFLAYDGTLQIPEAYSKIVENISGISTLLKTEFRIPTQTLAADVNADQQKLKATKQKGFTTKQLMEAYKFPKKLSGKGQCIGLVELGGVYKKSDVVEYFKMMKLPVPKIIEVGTPIDDSNLLNNSEVTLDLQVVGTVAPGATLVIYYGNTIADAMQLIIQDTKNKPSVVSISWAGSEYNYSPFQVAQLNELFYQAALLGITVLAASGDHGAMNSRQFPNVSIPSSNPLVIGCGGTTITLNPDDSLHTEVVWNQNNGQIGSGGGFSKLYSLPTYQQIAVSNYTAVRGNTRGVPDLSANADGVDGYIVIFNGMKMAIGGTSAATPLIAGLFALMNESLGVRLGFVNTWLYQFANQAYSPITQGNNGYYPAAPFWNPATGLGSPIGEKLLELFKKEK